MNSRKANNTQVRERIILKKVTSQERDLLNEVKALSGLPTQKEVIIDALTHYRNHLSSVYSSVSQLQSSADDLSLNLSSIREEFKRLQTLLEAYESFYACFPIVVQNGKGPHSK